MNLTNSTGDSLISNVLFQSGETKKKNINEISGKKAIKLHLFCHLSVWNANERCFANLSIPMLSKPNAKKTMKINRGTE